MIRKYKSDKDLIIEYFNDYITHRSKLLYNYREDVYNDFMRVNPDCKITSHYFTRHLNEICNTRVKLINDKGRMVYIFVDAKEELKHA